MDLGITLLQRDTFLSSLALTKDVLLGLGLNSTEAEKTIATFRAHDEKRLNEHHTHYTDSEKMRSLAKAAAKELEEMFDRDAAEHTTELRAQRNAVPDEASETGGETPGNVVPMKAASNTQAV